jgi:hypothetical protein
LKVVDRGGAGGLVAREVDDGEVAVRADRPHRHGSGFEPTGVPFSLPAELHLGLAQDPVNDLRRQWLAFGDGEDAVSLGAVPLLRVHVACLRRRERPLGHVVDAEVAGRSISDADHEEVGERKTGLVRLLHLGRLRLLRLGGVFSRGVEKVGITASVARVGRAFLRHPWLGRRALPLLARRG